MQKQRSVARILGAVVGSLGLILVVICAYALKLAVTRYSDSNRIVSLTIASRDLTNTLVIFRLERGDTLSYLASAAPAPDSVLSSLSEQKGTVQKNYALALQSLLLHGMLRLMQPATADRRPVRVAVAHGAQLVVRALEVRR